MITSLHDLNLHEKLQPTFTLLITSHLRYCLSQSNWQASYAVWLASLLKHCSLKNYYRINLAQMISKGKELVVIFFNDLSFGTTL